MKRGFIIFFIFLFLLLYFPTQIFSLNKVNNWDFNGSESGWSPTNGNGTNTCGNNSSSVSDGSIAVFSYSSNIDGQTAFQGVTATGKSDNGRGMISQTITAPGSGIVKAKGKFSYYANSTTGVADSWVRLDLFDSTNTTFISSLGCVSIAANQSWTTTSFSSPDIQVTGGTTYTIRVTIRAQNAAIKNATPVTLAIDNIVVNFAPVGLTASSVTDSTNTLLNWNVSIGGSNTPGLNATTPYKIYRNLTSPVSTFLNNGNTNVYTDTSTVGNTGYYYTITDVDTNSEESPMSGEVNILTLPNVPGTPTFSDVTYNSLKASWTTPTNGADSYKIERCSSSSCSNFSQISGGVTDLFYDNYTLSGSTLYRYRIRATNTSGDGGYSGIGETTTLVEPIYSVTVSPEGTVEYGIILTGQSKSTIDVSKTQTATNGGNVDAKINIKTSQAEGGTPWTIGSSAGNNIFVHEFSTNSGVGWTKFEDSINYQTLSSSLGIGETINFNLKVTAPTDSDSQTKTITVTVQAVQP